MIRFIIRATPHGGIVRVHEGDFPSAIEATLHGMQMLADVEGHGAVRVIRADTVSPAQAEAMRA